MTFSGDTYYLAVDGKRLEGQLGDVFNLMKDRRWRTLSEISHSTGHPESSVSARLRDIRKEDIFKNYTMNSRRRDGKGTWIYQVVRSVPPMLEQIELFDRTYYE